MPTIPLTKFNGSMTSDANDTGSFCQICKHFDNFTKSHALIPYKDSEKVFNTGTPEIQTQVQLQNFLMYGGNMYALGRQVATAKALIYENTAIDTTSWSTPTNGQDTTYTISDFTFFKEYKGILWGASSYGLWSYNIGTTTFNESDVSNIVARAITLTSITQGLIHSKDDILYVGYNTASGSFIASKNGASGVWNITALTLPTYLKVVDICEYGNYLAILMAPIQVGGRSVVYLWDRDSSFATLAESIDLGNKVGVVMESIDGYLIVVSQVQGLNSSSQSKLVFSKYSGAGGFITFREILISQGLVSNRKQKYNNRLYFALTANATSIGGTTNDYVGIWSIGRNAETDPFSVNFDRLAKNDTSVQLIKGFFIVQDYFYISYQLVTSGDYELSKTNDQASYTATSVYKTVKNPKMSDIDSLADKKLIAVRLTYEAIPTSGQIVLKHISDDISSTVFTDTTVNSKYIEMRDANGTPFTDGRDFEFQFESKGVTVVGFEYTYEKTGTSSMT